MQNRIPENWQKVKLGEVVNVYGGGTPSTQIKSYWNGDVPWLTPAELTNHDSRFISGTASYITESGLHNSSARVMPENSILLTSRATIGNVTINTIPMSTNQGFINIEPKEVDRDFFYHWLRNNRRYLNQIAIGSTFPELSKSVFKEIETEIPNNKEEQKRIGKFVSVFDEKIELNNKIAKTLGEMAQAIFKEGFVDQEGKEYAFSDLATYTNGGVFGKIINNDGRGLPLIKIADLNRGITENTEWIDRKVEDRYYISDGDLIFSWSGSIELEIWDKGEAVLNQHLFNVKPRDGFSKGFLYFALLSRLRYFKQIAGSKATTMGHIKKEHIVEQKINISENRDLSIFALVYRKLVQLKLENQKLAKMRNLLLPKLMKGEIRV